MQRRPSTSNLVSSRLALRQAIHSRRHRVAELAAAFGSDWIFTGGLSNLGIVVEDRESLETEDWIVRRPRSSGRYNYFLYNIQRDDHGVIERYADGSKDIHCRQSSNGEHARVVPATESMARCRCLFQGCRTRYSEKPSEMGEWCYHTDNWRTDEGFTRIRDVRARQPTNEPPKPKEQTRAVEKSEPKSEVATPSKEAIAPKPRPQVKAKQMPTAPPEPRRAILAPPEEQHRQLTYTDGAKSLTVYGVPYSQREAVIRDMKRMLAEEAVAPAQPIANPDTITANLTIPEFAAKVSLLNRGTEYDMDAILDVARAGWRNWNELDQKALRLRFSNILVAKEFHKLLGELYKLEWSSRQNPRKGMGRYRLYKVIPC